MSDESTTPDLKRMSIADFEAAVGEPVSQFVAQRFSQCAFAYHEISPAETQKLIIRIIDALLDPTLDKSGEHRRDRWEQGWGENLDALNRSPGDSDAIIPRYFDKYAAVRWCGRFLRPESERFEYNSLACLVDWLADQYLRGCPAIYEFGCGTGHHLLRVRDVNPTARLYGLDWADASVKILERIRQTGGDAQVHGRRFDYFYPDYSLRLERDAVIYTVASLEQVGTRWDKFVQYLIDNRPKLCVHIEPIAELLNPDVLLDNLSIRYFAKRNYLGGFLTGLREREANGLLKIHRAQRTHIGSLFIEGYSVVVWSPT